MRHALLTLSVGNGHMKERGASGAGRHCDFKVDEKVLDLQYDVNPFNIFYISMHL